MTTIDDRLSEMRSVRNDIWRCRKLLKTGLPEVEREMIEKRLLEQRSAFEGLLASTFPLALKLASRCEETGLGLAGTFGRSSIRPVNAGGANRKDTSASGEIAGIDEPGEVRIALVDNVGGAKHRIVNQARRNMG